MSMNFIAFVPPTTGVVLLAGLVATVVAEILLTRRRKSKESQRE